MRLFYFGNNRLGLEVLRRLVEGGEEVVGLAVHPSHRARYRSELLEMADLPAERVFEGSELADDETLERIAGLRPDLGVSVLFGYIFAPELLGLFSRGIVNLHPSLLPWNRGAYPNVWSLVDGTPAGVTVHWIDEGVDTGDVIAQREVPVEPVDTGATLYRKLEHASVTLFSEVWPMLREGAAPRHPQRRNQGTHHRVSDVDALDRLDLDAPTTARTLLDRLRARTFRPFDSAWFEAPDGRRVYVRVDLEYADPREDSSGEGP